MKKKILLLMVLAVSIASNAQFTIDPGITLSNYTGQSWFSVIPRDFCKDNKPLIIAPGSRDIYDSNLSLFRTYDEIRNWYANLPQGTGAVEFTYFNMDEDTSDGYNHFTGSYNEFYYTQTLFNDDEKLEILLRYYDTNSSKRIYCVYNEDGEQVGEEFEMDGGVISIVKLNGDYYFVTGCPYSFYKINKTSSSDAKAPKLTQPVNKGVVRYFDLNGQNINPNTAKGEIIIKTDGVSTEKVLMK